MTSIGVVRDGNILQVVCDTIEDAKRIEAALDVDIVGDFLKALGFCVPYMPYMLDEADKVKRSLHFETRDREGHVISVYVAANDKDALGAAVKAVKRVTGIDGDDGEPTE